MGFFGAAHGWGGAKKPPPPPKICHTYPTMMKPGTVIHYRKKIQTIYESRDTPLEFCWHQHFFTGNQKTLLNQEIPITNMLKLLMVSAKMATPALLKIKVFWNKGYYVIHSVYDVTNKIWSHGLNYIMGLVMWPNFGNSSICIREVIITLILWRFDQKNHFLKTVCFKVRGFYWCWYFYILYKSC